MFLLNFFTRKKDPNPSTEERILVTYKNGIYDITDYVDEHPGGEQILLADGKSLEPFWKLSPIHNTPEVLELLETMKIGNVPKENFKETLNGKVKSSLEIPVDSYFADPKRHAVLTSKTEKSFNAEVPFEILGKSFAAPNEERILVTYKNGIYDITDYVDEHPGGEQILLADGKSLEPFWKLSPVHNTPEVLELLETMKIGNVPKENFKETLNGKVKSSLEVPDLDSYFADPERHAVLTPKTENAEVPSEILGESFATPNEERILVTYKNGIYDITNYVDEHPGGEQILLAEGKSLEPFWKLSAVHNTPEVLELLETMKIGNVTKENFKETLNGKVGSSFEEPDLDPFSADPQRHAALTPITEKPFNAEVSPEILGESFLTPNNFYFVRNHLPVPNLDPENYRLKVEVEGTKKSLILTLDELKKIPKHTITAAMMCAGNRRKEMHELKPIKSMNWAKGAIGNAIWAGARLKDVLEKVGITEDEERLKHVQFEAMDIDPAGKPFGGSIPLWRAVSKREDVILAYEMNGAPLPRDHGFPVRVFAPGVAGARNVKWLAKIIVSENESQCHWYQNDYKGFSTSTDYGNVDFSSAPAIQDMPVNSVVCNFSQNETVEVKDGHILAKGYAYAGGGRQIIRVDVTADQGENWLTASLNQTSAEISRHWSWTLWSSRIPVEPGIKKVEIWVKAVDSSYHTQPETFKHIWNFRGVACNAYDRVTINLK